MHHAVTVIGRVFKAALGELVTTFLRRMVAAIGLTALLVGLVFAVQIVPEWQVKRASVRSSAVQPEAKTTPADVASIQNEMRKTFIQIVGGAFALFGLYFTYVRSNVAEQGHITDRYTKAIEQLGAVRTDNRPNLEVRLGAIYALERIAYDSARDRRAIKEVLTAYVRQNAPTPLLDLLVGDEEEPPVAKAATEIQAIITVLGRRKLRSDQGRLDLSGCDLRGVDFRKGNFRHTILDKSWLEGALFSEARVQGTQFKECRLKGASFSSADLLLADFAGANLEGANFRFADSQGATFRKAHLQEADFTGAHLEGAGFEKAYLDGSRFNDAHLAGARFRTAQGLDPDRFEDAKEWRKASFDSGFFDALSEKLGQRS